MTFVLIMIFGIVITGCKQKEEKVEVVEVKIDLINDEFPEAKKEVMETYDAIVQSIKEGDIERLISLHAYSPKFTEFKNGELRNGDVANVTFHSDFHFKFGEDLVVVNDQLTLLFVKTGNGWKLVHEHHSPLNAAEENS